MAFNRLAAAVTAIELHRALDLECSRIHSISQDTNKDEPFLVRRNTLIYSGKGHMAVEIFVGGEVASELVQ
jgi:hypothetical protein